VVQPSTAKRLQASSLERGRHPTETRQVVANPWIAAGSTVTSDWLRLFPATKEIKPYANLKKLRPTLDSGNHSNAHAQRRAGEHHQPSIVLRSCMSPAVPPVSCSRWVGLNGSGELRGFGRSFVQDLRRCRCDEARWNACSGWDYATTSAEFPLTTADIHGLGDAEATLGAS
jgi:hypothetical protein